MKKPIIGITMDAQEGGGYSLYNWYALRKNYCDAVAAHGGVPLPLPHHIEHAGLYATMIDGLLITGGDFDIDPTLYQATYVHPSVKFNKDRTIFERHILEAFSAKGGPVLGICGGHQLMNVVRGGTLIQHIPDENPSPIFHEQKNPRCETSHTVIVETATKLHTIVGTKTFAVNSGHHQAIKTLGENLVINCRAEDGVIEGIEDPTHLFFIGVQWHPEFLITSCDHDVMDHFVRAAQQCIG